MINPKCSVCGKELEDYGAIILSPPENNKVIKNHICKKCYNSIINEFNINKNA